MKPKVTFVFSTRNSVFPEKNSVDGPNLIGGMMLNELIKRGYQTTTFATQLKGIGSTRLVQSSLNSFFNDFDIEKWALLDEWTKAYLLQTYDSDLLVKLNQQKDIDTDIFHIHNHSFYTALPFLTGIDQPKIFTLHNPVTPTQTQVTHSFMQKYPHLKNCYFIAISNYMASTLSDLNVRTIYHGIDIREISFNPSPAEHLVFAGRMSRDKGPHIAVQTSLLAKRNIILCGRKSTGNLDYFNQEIEPSIDNVKVVYDQNCERKHIINLFAQAKAFLFPLQWEEPFGLVMIESMASGTPVIAYAKGSVPEIIKDGVTGFVVNPSDSDIRGDFIVKKTGLEGLCEAVERLYSLPDDQYQQMRKNCRQHVEENFTVEKMVDNYEKAYREIIDHSKNR